jgi:hypothetical protein
MAEFGTKNLFYDRIMEKNEFYNKGVKANNGQEYTMSPYHVLWPIPVASIQSNTQGIINQNFGYSGFENNVAPLETIPAEDDI